MDEPLPTWPPNPERLELEELTSIQPGLARLMPEIGARMWKCFYAVQAKNWPMAEWQLSEMAKLLRLCTVTRPKYGTDLRAFIQEDIEPMRNALQARDTLRFRAAFFDAIDAANDYHRRWKKPWIVWKLPSMPPPDLDLTAHAED
jgi:hypothetical protein